MVSDHDHLPNDNVEPEREIEAVLHALDEKVQHDLPAGELVQQLRRMLTQRGSAESRPQEQALRQDEQRFRSLFDYNVDPVFWVDPQGRFGAINPAGEKLTGYSLGEIQKLTVRDICAPECLEDTLHALQLAVAGDPRHIETAIYRKDGRRVELGVAGGPIFVDGQLQGIFGVAKDITEPKRAARALQESHDRLALALEAGQAGLVQWDLRTNKAWWNAYAFQIHGYPPGAFAPTFEFWLSSLYPEDAPAVVKAIKRCMEQRQPDISVEYRVLRPTGEIRWVRGMGRFAFDPAGVAESFTGIAMDITPQRRAEERLSFLSKASGLLASSLDPGQILSRLTRLSVPFLADFCVIYQIDSPQTFHLVARTHVRPELEPVLDRIGERFQTIPTHPGSRLRAAIQTGEVQLLSHATVEDCRRATEDPELLALWVKMQCHSTILVPLAAHGQTLGVLFLFMTESQRVYSTDDVAAAQELGARAAMALLHARLYTDAQNARTGAEAADQAKDHFLAVLSHELRNPLTPVLATAALLKQQPGFDADTREQLDIIQRNAELEARLIDDLLDITRITNGKVTLHKQIVALGTVLQRAVEVCQPDIEARHLHFAIDASDGPHIVDADATRLQQVFWNLLKNAIKFTPEGGSVGVRCRRDDAHQQVIVEVRDSGIGIEPDALARIFEPFEQAESGITRRFGGLGLGLTITQAMVKMLGGTISAASEGKGRGAIFLLRLPLLAVGAEPASTTPPAAVPPTPARSLRVLLVEDHNDTARVMDRLLRTEGHQVHHAGDVATALKLAEEQRFDLMLSDLGLPDGNGLDLMRTLQSKGMKLPAIALSGYGQESDVQQSREAGFLAHLTKPVSPPKLAEVIATVVAMANP